MAAVHDGGIGERKQLALDAPHQRVEIAAREIGTPDRAGEQHVSREHHALAHQAHAPGRVPRGVTDREPELPDLDRVPGGQRPVGGRRRVDRHSEREPLLHGVIVQLAVRRMQVDGRRRFLSHAQDPHHVIQMRVRDPDRRGARARGGDLAQDQARFLARIDDGAFGRRLVDDEVTVLDERAVGDLHDSHEPTAAFSFSRSAARYFSTAIAAVVASPTAVVI